MVKWPFSRKNQTADTSVPPEVQEYYQAEKRDRTGMAWLLAAATLIATVLLAIGLFYGGRWAYRTLFTDDNQTETRVDQDTENVDEAAGPSASQDAERDEQAAPDSNDEPAVLPGDGTNEPDDTADEAADRPAQTPRTGPADLPSTGPSSNL